MGGSSGAETESANAVPSLVGLVAELDRILTMAEAVLTCRGFPLGEAFVPAFETTRGQVAIIQLPTRFGPTPQLADTLAGVVRRPEVEVRGQGVVAGRAEAPVGWRRWWFNPSPSQWLVYQGFPPGDAAAILARHRIDDRFRLSQYGAGPRAVLGLEAALRSGPDVVVFNTSGLDPKWEVTVQEVIQSCLDRTAAVYLATPFLSDGAVHRRSMPGETVVEVTSRSPASV